MAARVGCERHGASRRRVASCRVASCRVASCRVASCRVASWRVDATNGPAASPHFSPVILRQAALYAITCCVYYRLRRIQETTRCKQSVRASAGVRLGIRDSNLGCNPESAPGIAARLPVASGGTADSGRHSNPDAKKGVRLLFSRYSVYVRATIPPARDGLPGRRGHERFLDGVFASTTSRASPAVVPTSGRHVGRARAGSPRHPTAERATPSHSNRPTSPEPAAA